MENNKKLYLTLIMTAVIIGCLLRCLIFFEIKPFWHDECALVLNCIERINYFKPLEDSQAAPQLFMYLSKLFSYLPFKDEISLRLLPFIASILSIAAFYFTAEKFFSNKTAKIIALFAFSLSYPLIDYAQQFKQYSTDVLTFLLIILTFFHIDKFNTVKKKVILGTVFALSIWFSFGAIFGIASFYLTLMIFDFKKFKNFLISLIPFILSFIAFYILNSHLNSNSFLHYYWADAFINKGIAHFINLFISNVSYALNSPLVSILIPLSIVFILTKERIKKNFLIIFPLLIVLILSFLNIYPFSTRVILFLIPVFILLAAKILDFINFKNKILKGFLTFFICLLLILPSFMEDFGKIIFKGYDLEDIKTPLSTALDKMEKGDILYIPDGNEVPFRYYKRFFKIKNPVIIEEERVNDDKTYLERLQNLNKGTRYFYIYSHFPRKYERLEKIYLWAKEKEEFKAYMDKKGNALIIFKM